jgi:hypothetical protein
MDGWKDEQTDGELDRRRDGQIFWDITPYILFKISRHFRGKYRAHLQSLRVSQERNQLETGSELCSLTLQT